MSSLLHHLNKQASFILWKRYEAYTNDKGKVIWMCLLRFTVVGYSSVVIGKGKTQYLAGARAMSNYRTFADSVGMDITVSNDDNPYEPPTEIELDLYRHSDDEWFNILAK